MAAPSTWSVVADTAAGTLLVWGSQSPKGNWMTSKAELIKYDFAAPAER